MLDPARIKLLVPYVKLPQIQLIGGFASVILIGTFLLLLPWSQSQGDVGFVDALFTATSAVCVTGLIVVDTATAYTRFGQTVIMVLIQVGGLGIMTFAALTFLMLGRRLSLASQTALQDAFFQRDLGVEFKKRFRQILLITFITELLGVIFIFSGLIWRNTPLGFAFFSSLFHAISAFCNAGFSIYSDNLMYLRGNPVIITTVMLLIVLGGLGHTVLAELWHYGTMKVFKGDLRGPVPLSVHARIVLASSFLLILGGCLTLLILGLTAGEATWGIKFSTALFQSITARTAGFNTVEIGLLPLGSLWLLTILMFIGGSPGSCAGGVKTTALAIYLAELRAKIRGEDQTVLWERRVPKQTVWRTTILIRLAILWNILGVLLLLYTEGRGPGGPGLHDVIFEQISAFGTVGLSTGLTGKLTTWGRLWIIATMFVGRVGPLTIAMGLAPVRPLHVTYPEAKVMIG